MPPTTGKMNSKKSGFRSWTSFEDGLAEYKENELRKEWWYYVSEDTPYTTRNERRQNKKLGDFIQPIKHVKPIANSVEAPIVDLKPVIEPVVEPKPIVEPAESESVFEPIIQHELVVKSVEPQLVVEDELEAVVESKIIVEAKIEVSEVVLDTDTEDKSEVTVVEVIPEGISETVVAQVESDAEADVEFKSDADVEAEVCDEVVAEVKTEVVAEVQADICAEVVAEIESDTAALAELETVTFESEFIDAEVEAELSAVVEAELSAVVETEIESVTVETKPEVMSDSDIAVAEETVSIIEQFNKGGMNDMVTEVAPVSEMPVIVLDAASEKEPVAEPVALLAVEEIPVIEEVVVGASEAPIDVSPTSSEELQVTETELVADAPITETTPITVDAESEDLLSMEAVVKDEESVKDLSSIQNMYAKTQPPPSYFDDMKTH